MTVTSAGPYSLSAPINVSSWNEGTYTLKVRALDAAGNWSLNASTVLNVRAPLYFSTFGNTNPPGVGGTADDADIYNWSGTAFTRSIDASGAGSLDMMSPGKVMYILSEKWPQPLSIGRQPLSNQ